MPGISGWSRARTQRTSFEIRRSRCETFRTALRLGRQEDRRNGFRSHRHANTVAYFPPAQSNSKPLRRRRSPAKRTISSPMPCGVIRKPFGRICHVADRRPGAPRPPNWSERSVIAVSYINGHIQGRYLDDKFFWPIFERAEALNVPIYLHPTQPPKPVIEASYGGFAPIAFSGRKCATTCPTFAGLSGAFGRSGRFSSATCAGCLGAFSASASASSAATPSSCSCARYRMRQSSGVHQEGLPG